MPNLTVTHEAPLELIRQHPALAVDLLRAFTGLVVSDQADIRLGPNSLNAIVPAEFTADAVVIAADPATARRVLEAIRETGASDADRKKLVTIILKRASDAARLILEDLMTAIEWKDDWVESFVDQGIAKGLEQGKVQAKVTDLMKVLAVRDLHPTKKQLARVAGCTDLATLDRWFDRSLIAASAAEVFAD